MAADALVEAVTIAAVERAPATVSFIATSSTAFGTVVAAVAEAAAATDNIAAATATIAARRGRGDRVASAVRAHRA